MVEPGEAVARYYQQEARVQDALREQQRVWLTQQARTADGIRIEIAANIAHSVEAQAAFGNGAEGVGLFRTEMLYMDRTSAPGESELYAKSLCGAGPAGMRPDGELSGGGRLRRGAAPGVCSGAAAETLPGAPFGAGAGQQGVSLYSSCSSIGNGCKN